MKSKQQPLHENSAVSGSATTSYSSSSNIPAATAASGSFAEHPPRRSKRLSEEDPKSLMKRVALGDVTNKQQQHPPLLQEKGKLAAVPSSGSASAASAAAFVAHVVVGGGSSVRLTRSKKKEIDSHHHGQSLMLCSEQPISGKPTDVSFSSDPENMSTDDEDFPIKRAPARSAAAVAAHERPATMAVGGARSMLPAPIAAAVLELDEWDNYPHSDIDQGDEVDPQLCCVYVNDIYAYLRETEVRYQPTDYMLHQKDITGSMRAILVDWLVEVADEYKLSSETLYLAVSYIDRYLSKKTVLRGKLQLVGVASMLLAAKYEEIYAPSVDEFVYIADNTYAKEEVFAMESSILDALEFCLTGATTKNFLRRFLKAAGTDVDLTVTNFANYLCELSLHDYCFTKYLPSVVAASAVCLALHTLNKPLCWSSTLEYYTRMRLSDEPMRRCIAELLHHHKTAPRGNLQAVQEKYKNPKFCRVSDHSVFPPASSLPF